MLERYFVISSWSEIYLFRDFLTELQKNILKPIAENITAFSSCFRIMTEWLSSWRHMLVLVLWLVHTTTTLQPLKEFKSLDNIDRRLVSAFSPDLPAAKTLDGITVAGVVKAVADKEEAAFSRTSVEAPPDSLDTATFTKQVKLVSH